MTVPWLLILAQAAAVMSAPIAGERVDDPVLAEQRGGFRLPNGVDVALSVQTQTAVDGVVLLRTVFQVDQGSPTFTIYAPKAGETVALGAQDGSEHAITGATAPTIRYDRNGGLQVTPGTTGPTVSFETIANAGALPAGLTEVASGTVTDAGTVGETTIGGIRTASLVRPDLTITHLAGNAFGSAIANSGSDRLIDTQTTVSINLGNVGPDTAGSAMFRVLDLALGTVAIRGN